MAPMERPGIRVSLERRVNLVDLVEMDTPERGLLVSPAETESPVPGDSPA